MITKNPYLDLMKIIKEDGVKDLPMTVKGKFAQAIKEERVNGKTTPIAEDLLSQALVAAAVSR